MHPRTCASSATSASFTTAWNQAGKSSLREGEIAFLFFAIGRRVYVSGAGKAAARRRRGLLVEQNFVGLAALDRFLLHLGDLLGGQVAGVFLLDVGDPLG